MAAGRHALHLIGNAHLDPVWLWRWQEGFAEIKATFRSALDRMREFPDFIFTCGGAACYQWVEQNAPDMFEEIRERVAEGRWVIVGGWWIQPDCNLPSGESFARHGLYSQRYYREKFNVTAQVGYNVDSFGHHGMLPQILKKSGMDYYVFMRPDKQERTLPGPLFWWESADGSRVMAYRIVNGYGVPLHESLEAKLDEVRQLPEQPDLPLMAFYGVGNHGGGPTIAHLRMIDRLREEWGRDALRHSSPDAYFRELSRLNPQLSVWRDDLQHHASGCYSAHSETKASNRKAEHRLLTAEKASAIAHHLLELPYPGAKLAQAWQNVMFNQFHDIMGGCSVKEAYDDARESYGEALHIASVALNAALQKLSWSIDTMKERVAALSKEKDWALWEQDDLGVPLVVFNPLSWEVTAPVQVNKQVKSVSDENEAPVPVQTVRGSRTNRDKDKWDTLFMASLPPMGYRVYWLYRDKELSAAEPPADDRKGCQGCQGSEGGAFGGGVGNYGGCEGCKGCEGCQGRQDSEDGKVIESGNSGEGGAFGGGVENREGCQGSEGGKVSERGDGGENGAHGLHANGHVLENDSLRLELEPHTGHIRQLTDKRRGVAVFAGPAAVPVVIDEYESDTWGHGITSYRNEIGRFGDAAVALVEDGPLRARLRVTSRYGASVLQQDFLLYRDRGDIEVKARLDWREKHKMLKLSFPANVERPRCTYEIPYGFLERPADGKEEPGQQWVDVSGPVPGGHGGEGGLTLINDSKYSYDVQAGDLRMTVARGAIYADHYGMRDELCEFMDQGIQEFGYRIVPHAGGWTEANAVRLAYELNVQPVTVIETYHKGTLPQKLAGIAISADHIVVAAFKKAEDGNGYILRCYETDGRGAAAAIRLPLLGREWEANFGPCEIKTFRIPLRPEEPVTETNLIED